MREGKKKKRMEKFFVQSLFKLNLKHWKNKKEKRIMEVRSNKNAWMYLVRYIYDHSFKELLLIDGIISFPIFTERFPTKTYFHLC